MYRYQDSPKDNKSLVTSFTQFITEKQNTALKNHNFFSIALDIRHHDDYFILSILEKLLLNNEHIFKQVQWSKWKIYFVSENLVPLKHPKSHYNQFQSRILNPMIHKYNLLNLGPTIITINENNLDILDKKNIGINHLIGEFTQLLPESIDLMVLSPFIELDRSNVNSVVTLDNNRIILNYLIYHACKDICFILSICTEVTQSTFTENYHAILNEFKTKITTFRIDTSKE